MPHPYSASSSRTAQIRRTRHTVDHRNSTWKPDILERVGVKQPDSLCSAAVTEHRIDTCAFAQDFRRTVAARTADVVIGFAYWSFRVEFGFLFDNGLPGT